METQTHETTPIPLAVRSFRINVAQEALVDLRRRVAATLWLGRSWRGGWRAHVMPAVPRHTRHQRCHDQPDLIPNCVLTIEMSTGVRNELDLEVELA
jgi:hypothetical protein